MELKMDAITGDGVGVCARTGAVTNAARKAINNKIRGNLISFPYNTIEMQSQAIFSTKAKKTDAAR
jgi:hypothetical protein